MSNFKTRYDHAKPVVGDLGASLTSQQYKDECDVDIMMARFKAGQPLPVKPVGTYGDFSGIGDYMDCLNRINRAREDFDSLPSAIRDRFGHDSTKFVDFVLDPKNEAECLKLGLRKARAVSDTDRIINKLDSLSGVTLKGESATAQTR